MKLSAVVAAGSIASLLIAAHAQDVLMGMRIERVNRRDAGLGVTTTGAEFVLEKESALRRFQRIPVSREVVRIQLPSDVLPLTLGTQSDFSCTISGPSIDLTVQGDSLVILKANRNLTVQFNGLFKPAYHASKEGKWLLIDGMGGFGIYPVEAKADGNPDFHRSVWTIEHPMQRGDETWVSVFPPRPYDWKRAYTDLAAHEGNGGKYAFPYELGLAWEPDDGHLVLFDDYYYGELASIGERLKKVIGLDDFARYPGTPAQFLQVGKRGV